MGLNHNIINFGVFLFVCCCFCFFWIVLRGKQKMQTEVKTNRKLLVFQYLNKETGNKKRIHTET